MDERILRDRARQLRKDMTEAERLLWKRLRQRQIVEVRFRRQVPLGRYIADFACFDPKIVIEVDGGQHAERESKDEARTAWLESEGFLVLRFWNTEVLLETEAVVDRIFQAVSERRA